MNHSRSQIDRCLEAGIGLVTAHGYALELLELAKEVFYEVTPAVHVLINGQRPTSIGSLRDHDWHALCLQSLYQPLNIKRFVCQQRPKLLVPDHLFDSFAVMPLAWHQSELEQIAQRIAQGQYLGAHAPTRVPYGLALSPAPWP